MEKMYEYRLKSYCHLCSPNAYKNFSSTLKAIFLSIDECQKLERIFKDYLRYTYRILVRIGNLFFRMSLNKFNGQKKFYELALYHKFGHFWYIRDCSRQKDYCFRICNSINFFQMNDLIENIDIFVKFEKTLTSFLVELQARVTGRRSLTVDSIYQEWNNDNYMGYLPQVTNVFLDRYGTFVQKDAPQFFNEYELNNSVAISKDNNFENNLNQYDKEVVAYLLEIYNNKVIQKFNSDIYIYGQSTTPDNDLVLA